MGASTHQTKEKRKEKGGGLWLGTTGLGHGGWLVVVVYDDKPLLMVCDVIRLYEV